MMYNVVNFINIAVELYILAIIIVVILSWFNISPANPIVQILRRVTDPLLGFIRRYIPPIAGLDISPIIAILLINLTKRLVFNFILP